MDEKRFLALWERCLQPGAQSDGTAVFAMVYGLYSSPGRCYHSPDHIEYCLTSIDRCRDHIPSADAVELGIWFHDVIYSNREVDNELRSAELFRKYAKGVMDPDFVNEVFQLVLITKHVLPPRTENEKYIVDVDLSSFGRPWDKFNLDSKAVRDEFPHICDADFYPRQMAFLQSLLDRKHLYSTSFFREHMETVARENIRRQIGNLEKKLEMAEG